MQNELQTITGQIKNLQDSMQQLRESNQNLQLGMMQIKEEKQTLSETVNQVKPGKNQFRITGSTELTYHQNIEDFEDSRFDHAGFSPIFIMFFSVRCHILS